MMISRIELGAALALSSLSVLPACEHPAQAAVSRPIPVKVQAVQRNGGVAPSRYSGSLEPAVRVDVAFRVSGYVVALGELKTAHGSRPLDKGDFVKKGSVLARLRPSEYQDKVATSQAQAAEAKAAAKLAQDELARAQRLFAADAITQSDLDVSVAHADSARAQLDAAQSLSSEAGVALSDTVLRAPMDGVVLSRSVEVGSLVAPGQPALAIADTRSVKAVFGAPQALVEKLALGSALRVFVGAESEGKAPEKLLDARVTRIAPAADSNGRVFSIEAELPNPDGSLRPGSVVSVHVPDAAQGDPLVVPLSAVVRSPRDSRGFAVFVFDGTADRATARLRDVQLGEVVGNSVTVNAGLTLGQRVVSVGAGLLRDGSDAVAIR